MAWPGRPLAESWGNRLRVTLKLATSLDGRIATSSGESRWITGEAARLEGRRLRGAHDGVLIGIGTALADDPQLTCRGAGKEPERIILDTHLRLPAHARVLEPVERARAHVFASCEAAQSLKAQALRANGAEVHAVGLVHSADSAMGGLDVGKVIEILAANGLSSLMVEGGGQVAAAFLRAGLVSALEWFRAGVLLGGDGRAGIGALGIARLADAPAWHRVEIRALGPDVWERYEKQESGCLPAS